jgi:hypothetical protein
VPVCLLRFDIRCQFTEFWAYDEDFFSNTLSLCCHPRTFGFDYRYVEIRMSLSALSRYAASITWTAVYWTNDAAQLPVSLCLLIREKGCLGFFFYAKAEYFVRSGSVMVSWIYWQQVRSCQDLSVPLFCWWNSSFQGHLWAAFGEKGLHSNVSTKSRENHCTLLTKKTALNVAECNVYPTDILLQFGYTRRSKLL